VGKVETIPENLSKCIPEWIKRSLSLFIPYGCVKAMSGAGNNLSNQSGTAEILRLWTGDFLIFLR
jgi:hypothetical protein